METRSWTWRESVVLAVYVGVLALVIPRHEPWLDEAQAWLMARDLNLFDLIFYRLRYEGTPGLWHVLLWFANLTHVPYAGINWLSGAFAIAGSAAVLWLSPFPLILRSGIIFSYFFWYQYAVVARSYCLLLLLVPLACHLYAQARTRTALFTAVLAVMSNSSIHGALLAAGLAGAYLWELWPSRRELTPEQRRLHWQCGIVLVAAMLLVAVQVRLPQDISVRLMSERGEGVLSCGVLALGMIFRSLTSSILLSAWIVLVTCLWMYDRRCMMVYLLPTGLLMGLFGLAYASQWHQGAATLAWLTAIWTGWRRPGQRDMHRLMVAMIAVVLGFHLYWSVKTQWLDYHLPYSASRDAAAYLKATNTRWIAAHGIGSIAVLPYFRENRFPNLNGGQLPAHFVWSRANRFNHPDLRSDLKGNEQRLLICDKSLFGHRWLNSLQNGELGYRYEIEKVFPGDIWWQGESLESESLYLLRRVEESGSDQKASHLTRNANHP